ncbi:hypothetical protein RHGRI_001648 [Rhododendron griersonianum]|uniref:Uncharacterized protein n=1 Tax=Rhododendron griersonianum TaxID=479676 RepID=A0AAV6LLH9_9ERIC|nr:hypothetical protein RHGRI_001648 [Rhododendron griersonianum]
MAVERTRGGRKEWPDPGFLSSCITIAAPEMELCVAKAPVATATGCLVYRSSSHPRRIGPLLKQVHQSTRRRLKLGSLLRHSKLKAAVNGGFRSHRAGGNQGDPWSFSRQQWVSLKPVVLFRRRSSFTAGFSPAVSVHRRRRPQVAARH